MKMDLYLFLFAFEGGKVMTDKKFEKSKIEIVDLKENDIIVTSPGIPLPDIEWEEEQ